VIAGAAVGGEEVGGWVDGEDGAAAAAAAAVVVVTVACCSGGVMASVLLLAGEFTFAALVFFFFLLVAFFLSFAPFQPVALLLFFALFHDSAVGEGREGEREGGREGGRKEGREGGLVGWRRTMGKAQDANRSISHFSVGKSLTTLTALALLNGR